MVTGMFPKARQSTRVMLWTLLIVYVFNFLDRQIVNILAEPIRRDLDLSDTQIGLMTGLAFALGLAWRLCRTTPPLRRLAALAVFALAPAVMAGVWYPVFFLW